MMPMIFFWLPTLLALITLPCAVSAAAPTTPSGVASDGESLATEFRLLQSAGKLDEAISAAEKLVASDRKLIAAGPAGPEGQKALKAAQTRLYDTLSWLVEQDARREDYAASARRQRELAEIAEQTFGKDDDRAFEARRDVAYRELLQRMKAEDARALVQADQSAGKVDRLLKQGRNAEARTIVEENLRTRQRLLGEHDTRTAESLSRLALCLHWPRELGRAEDLYRRAIAIEAEALPRQTPNLASYMLNLAKVLATRGKADDAAEYYRRAAAIYELLAKSNVAYQATAETCDRHLVGLLQRQAGKAIREENWDSARKTLQEVLDLQMRRFGPPTMGTWCPWQTTNTRLAIAHVARVQSLSPDERRSLYEADADFRRANDPRLRPTSEECLKLTEQCRATYERLLGPEAPETATALTQIAVIHYGQGAYLRAEPLFRRALEIRKKIFGEGHPQYAASLTNLAALYRGEAEYARAESLYHQALEIRKTAFGEGHPEYAASLNSLANLYYDEGDYARAETLFRQALDIYKKALGEGHLDYARTLNSLGILYIEQGDYARAEPLFRRTLEIRKKVLGENHLDYAGSLNDLAILYKEQEDYARAEPLFRQALGIYKNVLGEGHLDYAWSLNNLAVTNYAQGNYAPAEPLFRQALAIEARALGENHPDYAKTLYNLARLHEAQGDFARAEPLCVQALEIRKKALGEAHPDYAATLSELAVLRQAQGDYAGAEPLARQAVEAIRRHVEATAVVQSDRQQLAMLQSVRKYLDGYLGLAADHDHDHGYMVPDGHGAEVAYREMLAWKGIVLRRERQIRTGTQSPELAASFQQLQRVATQLSKMAWTTPDPKQAADWRQRVANLSAEKERLEAKLVARSDAYHRAKQQVTLEQLQAALPADAVLVDFLEYAHQTPGKQQTGAGYPRTRGWADGQRRLLAFVIGHGHAPEMASLGAIGPISDAIDTWRTTFGMSSQGAAARKLLREKLWQPIEAKLKGAKIVLLSPDGALGRLPFGALPGKDAGKFLIEEYTLAIVPVPQMIPELVAETGRRELQKNLLLLGNVDYDAPSGKAQDGPPAGTLPAHPPTREYSGTPLGYPAQEPSPSRPPQSTRVPGAGAQPMVGGADLARFNPLPGTRGEIATIEKMYRQVGLGGAGLTLLDRSRANKAAFRAEAPRHRYLHMATHGFFVAEKQHSAAVDIPKAASRFGEMARGAATGGMNPGLLSGLALAGANRAAQAADFTDPDADDGILTAEEIGAMNLDGVQLVMLSACETGLGKAAGGEGLLGLQRAFQSAGTRTVVASLWSVPDEETRILMEEFYTNLWSRKLGRWSPCGGPSWPCCTVKAKPVSFAASSAKTAPTSLRLACVRPVPGPPSCSAAIGDENDGWEWIRADRIITSVP